MWHRRVDALLDRLDRRFGDAAARDQGAIHVIDAAAVTVRSTDAVRRGFSGSLTRALEATIDPLGARRLGTPPVPGHAISLDLSHVLDATSWLSFDASERVEARAPRDPAPSRSQAELLLAGVRARAGNVALRVGREQVAWAQRPGEGFFLAADGPALDLVSISGDEPFLLPGPLRRLGPTQATILVADLGPSAVRSHSKLLAYKVSIEPRRFLELGATFMDHYGGEGGRSASLGAHVIDFLPFADIFRTHNYTDTSRALEVDSDKLLGVDGRVRLARLAGLTLSTELLIDDFDVHRIRTLFTWDGSQSLSAVLPNVAGSSYSLRIGARHTGVRTYTHGALSDGITTRGRLLGDELGPDAKAFSGAVEWDPVRPICFTLEGRSAIYSRADYVTDAQGTYFMIRRVGAASNEVRDRAVVTFLTELGSGVAVTARAGGEHIRNADFTGGARRQYAAEMAVRFAR
jgi:hypothetical protein